MGAQGGCRAPGKTKERAKNGPTRDPAREVRERAAKEGAGGLGRSSHTREGLFRALPRPLGRVRRRGTERTTPTRTRQHARPNRRLPSRRRSLRLKRTKDRAREETSARANARNEPQDRQRMRGRAKQGETRRRKGRAAPDRNVGRRRAREGEGGLERPARTRESSSSPTAPSKPAPHRRPAATAPPQASPCQPPPSLASLLPPHAKPRLWRVLLPLPARLGFHCEGGAVAGDHASSPSLPPSLPPPSFSLLHSLLLPSAGRRVHVIRYYQNNT